MEPKNKDKRQFDFLPLAVSIETLAGISTPVILRGTPLPTKRSQIFSTAADNQKSVEIKVLLGERRLANKNKPIGSCLLKGIPPAPKGKPQICVTFEVDRFCKVKVEAVKLKSTRKIKATLEKTLPNLTNGLIQELLREAEENREEDTARSVIASAELQVREDQELNLITATTRKIEALIAEIGIALMEPNKPLISSKTKELEKLLVQPKQTYSPFGFGGLDSIFSAFNLPKSAKTETQTRQTTTSSVSKTVKPEMTNSMTPASTLSTMMLQSFLENIDPALELKRAGAWEAIESNRPDGCAQASHSMREVLRQLLDKLAPEEEVLKAPWYKRPSKGAPITRAMRIHYALAGTSDVVSESTLSLIHDLAAAVDSMYAKLSAESHSNKISAISVTRTYLSACEAVINLIASQRHS